MTVPDPVPQFPPVLKAKRQWLVWRLEKRNDQFTKVPYQAGGKGWMASSTSPQTWSDFQAAVRDRANYDGLGLALNGEICIDLDHCRNKETGALESWAEKIVKELNSYTEISPSGEGLHIWVAGELPPGRHRRDSVEMYSAGRYMTVTGNHLQGTPLTIEQRDVTDLRRRMAAGLLCPSKNGAESSSLDASKEDFKLCCKLARQFRGDRQRIDAEFRKSKLWRPKWDETRGDTTYGGLTIQRAIEQVGETIDWRELLICTEDKNPRPVPLLSNAVTALRYAPEWQGILAFDQFSLYVVARQATPWGKVGRWNDQDDSFTTEWLQRADIRMRSTNQVAEAIQAVAHEHAFHPVRDYLEGLTWDGVPRIESWLITYLGCVDTVFARAIGRRWLISGVARIFRPGVQADYTLLLEGPQGIQKSSALRALAGDDWFSDHVADLHTKDSFLDLHGNWIIELSELTAMRRAEIERVKAFLTARVDNFRPPYGRRSEHVPRSNIFAASTNDQQPFVDSTGNRRFWPARCGSIDVEAIQRDRDQLWAEAVAAYRSGEPWWLDNAELNDLATLEQRARYEPDVWDDTILQHAEDTVATGKRVTIADILENGIGKEAPDCTPADYKRVARCLTHDGWEPKQDRTRGPDRGQRFWVRK